MRTNNFKWMVLAIILSTSLCVVSCAKENNSNDNTALTNDNSTLTEESIVGKFFYTNKYPTLDTWQQSEIRFGADNTAFITHTSIVYETGGTKTSRLVKATYNLFYPNIVFEYNNRNISATFVDNNTLVFDGGDFDGDWNEEMDCMAAVGTPYSWGYVSGWHFYTSPQTITGQYVGQKFEGFNGTVSCRLYFGANYVFFDPGFHDCMGDHGDVVSSFSYPTFTIDEERDDSMSDVECVFVDANTIEVTFTEEIYVGGLVNITLTRVR